MVKAIKKAGWFRSTLVTVSILLGLITAAYGFSSKVKSDVGLVIDGKIKVHKLESDLEWQEKIHEIKTQQNTMDGKLDLIIGRLPE